MAETDLRIRKLWQHNQGVAAARNFALDYAAGDYYLFVDGDDYIGVEYPGFGIVCREKAVRTGNMWVYAKLLSILLHGIV